MLKDHHSLASTHLQDAGAAACVCDEMPVVAVLHHQCGQQRIIVVPPVVRHTHTGGTWQARGPLCKLVGVHPVQTDTQGTTYTCIVKRGAMGGMYVSRVWVYQQGVLTNPEKPVQLCGLHGHNP